MSRRFTSVNLASLLLIAPLSAQDDSSDEDDDIFELSPFEVSAQETVGYQATDTLAGTRLRTDLKDVGSSIQVITSEFLDDTDVTNIEELFNYTTSTEVSGVVGNFGDHAFSGGGGDVGDDSDTQRNPQGGTRIRGLKGADVTRDYFLTSIPLDSYNIERAEIQRGANSILFGLGSPAGITNSVLKSAYTHRDSSRVQFRVNSDGGLRSSLDFNRVLIEDTLGVRVAALHDDNKYRQEPAFEKDSRIYAALRWVPKIFEKGHTTIKANIETGEIDANRPHNIPPAMNFFEWFNEDTVNYAGFNPTLPNGGLTVAEGGSLSQEHYDMYVSPYVANNHWGWGGRMGLTFLDPDSSVSGIAYDPKGQGSPHYSILGTAQDGPDHYINDGTNLNAFGEVIVPYGAEKWKIYTVTDRGAFDFINTHFDGDTKREWRDFDAYNLSLSQTFLEDNLGFEFSFNKEDEENGRKRLVTNLRFMVDANTHLPNGDENPGFGRVFTTNASPDVNYGFNERETTRVTAFYRIDFRERMNNDGWLSSFLGEHTVNGVLSDYRVDKKNLSQRHHLLGPDAWAYTGSTTDRFSSPDNFHDLALIHYLSGNLQGVPLSEANIQGLSTDRLPPASTDITFYNEIDDEANPVWETRSFSVLNYRDNPDELWEDGNIVSDEVDSKALNWHGKFFNGNLVGLYGWREDTARNFIFQGVNKFDNNDFVDDRIYYTPEELEADPSIDRSTVPNTGTGLLPPNDPRWVTSFNGEETGQMRSWSVVLHTPQFIMEKLPVNEFSFFYNRSQNMQPLPGRVDIYGEKLPNPTGRTEDYGFRASLLNDKLSLRATWFEASAENSQANSVNFFWAGKVYDKYLDHLDDRNVSADLINEWFQVEEYGIPPLPRRSDYEEQKDKTTGITLTADDAQIRREWFEARTPEEFTRRLDPRIMSAWNLRDTDDGPGYNWATDQPAGREDVTDTLTEGFEFEAIFNPTSNWRIAFNAAQQKVANFGLGKQMDEYFAFHDPIFLDGYDPALGDITLADQSRGLGNLLIGNNDFRPNRTITGRDFVGLMRNRWLSANALDGAFIPEVREWRANLVTNYSFREGKLKGFSLGGALRWQDEVGIGYPQIEYFNEEGDSLGYNIDVTRPYYGPTETNIDLNFRYKRKIMNDSVDWTLQFNIKNAFNDEELIATLAQPDGTIATARIAPQTAWSLSSRFDF